MPFPSSTSYIFVRGLPRLDEVDCYAKNVVMAMWPNGRVMRRWFYEVRAMCSMQPLEGDVL